MLVWLVQLTRLPLVPDSLDDCLSVHNDLAPAIRVQSRRAGQIREELQKVVARFIHLIK